MKDRISTISRRICARSQIFKKCYRNGTQCDLHIEESAYVKDGEYTFANLEQDIIGFEMDVNRELSPIGMQCDRNSIKFRVDNDLLVFVYDKIAVSIDDETLEKIKTSEWIMEE